MTICAYIDNVPVIDLYNLTYLRACKINERLGEIHKYSTWCPIEAQELFSIPYNTIRLYAKFNNIYVGINIGYAY